MIWGPVSALPTFSRGNILALPEPTTITEALAQGYRPTNKWRRFAKIGDSVLMYHPDREVLIDRSTSVLLMIESKEELRALGYRFPFERRGQWSTVDNKFSLEGKL